MNSRNMEQLIEKYKREMLNYNARSTAPVTVHDSEKDEGVPDNRYEMTERGTSQQITEQPNMQQLTPPDTVGKGENELAQYVPETIAHIREDNNGAYDAMQNDVTDDDTVPSVEVMSSELSAMDDITGNETLTPERAPSGLRAEDNSASDIARYEEMSRRSVIKFSDLREDCRKIATGENGGDETKSRQCQELYNFLAVNTAKGKMSVETYASDRVFGIVNARVMVFIPLESGNVLIFDGLTDINGTSPQIELPAPSKETSLKPDAKGLPYAGYTVLVEHPDYVRAVFFNVPVFEDIESIQPVQILARATGTDEPNPIIVTNEEPPPIRGSAEE